MISATCTSPDGAAIWGTDATAVANCIDHSTCNYDTGRDPSTGVSRCEALLPIPGMTNDHPCANCTDPNQAGCACYRRMECAQPACTPPGPCDYYDGCAASWSQMNGEWDNSLNMMVPQTYNASTDICTMSNDTAPDGSRLEREDRQCAQRFGANGNDGEYTEEYPQISYLLFAQAALTATTALPFVRSNMAINAYNRCNNQTDSWDGSSYGDR